MRKLASIQEVSEIKKHPNADSLLLAKVLGWQVVISINENFNVGDKVVYFEIDSFLPIREEFEFLRKSSYKNSELLGEGFKLKSIKLRNEISQGLIMPLETFFNKDEIGNLSIGDDVTERLGVRLWEIPERVTTGGTILGEASGKIHVTDETRIQSELGLLDEFKKVKGYYITTKLDGSSHSISLDENGFHVFGHHYEYKNDGGSSFYRFVNKRNYKELLERYVKENNLDKIVIQGELCGPGIQGNKLKLNQAEWYVFTVDINNNRVGLDEMDKFMEFARENGYELRRVVVEEFGEEFPYNSVEELMERASKDPLKYYQGNEPEGIVVRPINPVYSEILHAPLSMKVINNKYLLK